MTPLIFRKTGMLELSVSLKMDSSGELAFTHKSRGLLKRLSFPNLSDAFNVLERIVSTSKPAYKSFSRIRNLSGEESEKYINFFRLSPSLVMVSSPSSEDGENKAAELFDEVRFNPAYSSIFPLPEELEVVYYKQDGKILVLVVEDKSR